ncbi:hypothetical protein FOZ63_017010, partial [Perkinsus olseni]
MWISVNSSNPGSTHDARVFQSSLLSRRLRSIPQGYWLCGDSAYALSSTMFTPYNNPPPNSAHASFNVAHKSVRSAIERRFRKLKRSWAICNGNLRLTPVSKSAKAILACFCLHNFQTMMREPEVELEEDEDPADGEDFNVLDVAEQAIEGLESRDSYAL